MGSGACQLAASSVSKLCLINSHLRPVMEYGMEVWGPRAPRITAAITLLAPSEAVLACITRMAAGVHITATEGAGDRQRCDVQCALR